MACKGSGVRVPSAPPGTSNEPVPHFAGPARCFSSAPVLLPLRRPARSGPLDRPAPSARRGALLASAPPAAPVAEVTALCAVGRGGGPRGPATEEVEMAGNRAVAYKGPGKVEVIDTDYPTFEL